MNVSTQIADFTTDRVGQPAERTLCVTAKNRFLLWTAFWWGGVGLCGFLFFLGVLDFPLSTKLSLYGVSIWLNAWLLGMLNPRQHNRSTLQVYHDCLVLWMLSYAFTNVAWEIRQ